MLLHCLPSSTWEIWYHYDFWKNVDSLEAFRVSSLSPMIWYFPKMWLRIEIFLVFVLALWKLMIIFSLYLYYFFDNLLPSVFSILYFGNSYYSVILTPQIISYFLSYWPSLYHFALRDISSFPPHFHLISGSVLDWVTQEVSTGESREANLPGRLTSPDMASILLRCLNCGFGR